MNVKKSFIKLIQIIRCKNFLHIYLSILILLVTSILTAGVLKITQASGYTHQVITIAGAILCITLLLISVRINLIFEEVGIRRSNFGKSLLYGLVFVLILRLSDLLYPNIALIKPFRNAFEFGLDFIFLLLFAFLEELLCRGIIFTNLNKKLPFHLALFTSSLIFSALHMLSPLMGGKFAPEQLFFSTFFGLSFATAFYYSRNIFGLSIAHFLYNLSSFFISSGNSKNQDWSLTILPGLYILIFTPLLIEFLHRIITKDKSSNQIASAKYFAYWFFIFIIFISIVSFFL